MKPIALLVIAVLAAPAAAASPADYAANFPIATPGEEAAWQIELGLDVHRWSQDGALRDLAVFNADGQAVPIDRWQAPARERHGEQRATIVLLGLPVASVRGDPGDLRLLVERDASGRLRRIEADEGGKRPAAVAGPRDWLLDAGAFEDGIDALELAWSAPSDGVIARFAVEASDDLQRWRSMQRDAAIVLLEQDGARIERRRIALDGTRANFLRLRRLDAGSELADLSATGIRGWREHGERDPLQWTAADLVAARDGAGTSANRHDYRLPAELPIEALRVELGNDNALASLVLSTPAITGMGPSRWNERARFVAFRLRQGDVSIDNAEIALDPVVRSRELRLDAASAVAVPPRVAAGWRAERLLFLAEGRAPFVLAVGHARERRAATPLNAATAALRARFGADWQPPLATLGPASEAAGMAALSEPPPAHAWRRWLLWGVLVGAAALIAGLALKLLRGQG